MTRAELEKNIDTIEDLMKVFIAEHFKTLERRPDALINPWIKDVHALESIKTRLNMELDIELDKELEAV